MLCRPAFMSICIFLWGVVSVWSSSCICIEFFFVWLLITSTVSARGDHLHSCVTHGGGPHLSCQDPVSSHQSGGHTQHHWYGPRVSNSLSDMRFAVAAQWCWLCVQRYSDGLWRPFFAPCVKLDWCGAFKVSCKLKPCLSQQKIVSLQFLIYILLNSLNNNCPELKKA